MGHPANLGHVVIQRRLLVIRVQLRSPRGRGARAT